MDSEPFTMKYELLLIRIQYPQHSFSRSSMNILYCGLVPCNQIKCPAHLFNSQYSEVTRPLHFKVCIHYVSVCYVYQGILYVTTLYLVRLRRDRMLHVPH
jgi:hypothetical protein